MPIKIVPIIYLPNPSPKPEVVGPRLGANQTKLGLPTYQSRAVIDVSGFPSDSVREFQDRYKGTSNATDYDGPDNGLSTFPRQAPADGPFYPKT